MCFKLVTYFNPDINVDLTKTYSFEQEYDNGSISSTDEDDDGNETDEVAPNESERVKQLIKVSI